MSEESLELAKTYVEACAWKVVGLSQSSSDRVSAAPCRLPSVMIEWLKTVL